MKSKQERIVEANRTYCEGHSKEGIEICSWENMPGWDSYMKGEMSEAELSEKAGEELAQLTQTFSKYLRKTDENEQALPVAEEDPAQKGKAKVANKIYRKACVDSGKSFCFFKNFKTWQDFVHGEIDEGEFYERALEEVRKAAAENQV